MKITVTLTVDIPDPSEWTTAFGHADTPAKIRADVREYVRALAADAEIFDPGSGEVAATVTLKPARITKR